MANSVIDMISAATALILAAILAFLQMPGGEYWQALRRMNTLLIVCYAVMGVSNLVTGIIGVSGSTDSVTCAAMLIVSMYQAMLFTATCVTFVAPRKASGRWLTSNGLAITLCGIAIVYALCRGGRLTEAAIWGGVAAYMAQLGYYCALFRRCYGEGLQMLERSYDEDMRGSLRLVRNSFLGALTVGVSALLYVILRLGGFWYDVFTCIYTLYYIYLVICVVNYRISAGYILKVVAAAEVKSDDGEEEEEKTILAHVDADEEGRLADAIERWVATKQFIRNDLTMNEIATELGTSHAILKWYFTNRLHTTFRTWRLTLRVEEAKRLLRDEDAPTSSVHTMVGVTDKSNFHKQFCKLVGMTPREYKGQQGV